jgi:hypothetical protein
LGSGSHCYRRAVGLHCRYMTLLGKHLLKIQTTQVNMAVARSANLYFSSEHHFTLHSVPKQRWSRETNASRVYRVTQTKILWATRGLAGKEHKRVQLDRTAPLVFPKFYEGADLHNFIIAFLVHAQVLATAAPTDFNCFPFISLCVQ